MLNASIRIGQLICVTDNAEITPLVLSRSTEVTLKLRGNEFVIEFMILAFYLSYDIFTIKGNCLIGSEKWGHIKRGTNLHFSEMGD